MSLHVVGFVVRYWQGVFRQLLMVCMHVIMMYGSKMFTCIVIGDVCFVFLGLLLQFHLLLNLISL